MSDQGPLAPLPSTSTSQMQQVLEAYARNAHTLTGPSRLEEQLGTARYKLANDVVLRKVYPGETPASHHSAVTGGGGMSYRLHHVGGGGSGYKKSRLSDDYSAGGNDFKHIMLQRERLMRHFQEQQLIELKDRSKEQINSSRLRQASGTSGHLSGEQIRILRECQKEAERRQKDTFSAADNGTREAAAGGKTYDKSTFKNPVPAAMPIMYARDKTWSELEETVLDGARISCFTVGGEQRLCLPQILNSVLERLSLKDINQACEELQIYCATCSAEQLQVLKDYKVLPETAYQCGLITKSDAERLCSFLLERNPPRASMRLGDPKASPFSFHVEHDCFGHCEGLVLPEAYTHPTARCIECLECEGLFSPQKFVCHAHKNIENRTCHWGFSSDNWRRYLRLSKSYTEEEVTKFTKIMDDFKSRFLTSNLKRQQDGDARDSASQAKRSKLDDYGSSIPAYLNLPQSDAHSLIAYLGQHMQGSSWSPGRKAAASPPPPPGYLSHGTSKLAVDDPELHGPLDGRKSMDMGRSASDNPASDIRAVTTLPPQSCQLMSAIKRNFHADKDCARFPTLADEISSIKEALDGAPVHAREAVLKILERLTQRVDRAERERDIALGRYKELHTRYELLEDDLAKKRGELRELLRQDSARYPRSSSSRRHSKSQEDSEYFASASLKQRSRSASNPVRHHSSDQEPTDLVIADRRAQARDNNNDDEEERAISRQECDRESNKSSNSSVSASKIGDKRVSSVDLPKIDLKTPAEVIEEEKARAARDSVDVKVKTEFADANEPEEQRSQNKDDVEQPAKDVARKLKIHAVSTDRDLTERMMKMEVELNALREEMSARSLAAAGTSNGSVSSVGSSESPGGPHCHNMSLLNLSKSNPGSKNLGSNGANSNSPTPSPPNSMPSEGSVTNSPN